MNTAGWFSPSLQWYYAPDTPAEAGGDLDGIRQLVTTTPEGFLGRYGIGNEAPRISLLLRSSHFGYEGRKLRSIRRMRIANRVVMEREMPHED